MKQIGKETLMTIKQIVEMIKTKCVHKIHDIKRRLDSINRLIKICEGQI